MPLARIDNLGVDAKTKKNAANYDGREQSPGESSDYIYYFHNDIAGIPEELTNTLGELNWRANYKIWGNSVSNGWSQLPCTLTAKAGTLPQNLRLQGQYLDRETGLHYNTFRFYDPDIGRFISPDPIGLRGGTNLHRYAPNPIHWTDPLGWACWSTERKHFWKAEGRNNPTAYSPENLTRINSGSPPMIQAEVLKGRTILIKDVPIELHHATIPQRVGGPGVHSAGNLQKLTPWDHELVDPYRNTGETLIRIIIDIDIWKP